MKSQLPDAFEKLVEENQSSLRFYIRSLGVEASWVDDIAQETFILLLRKWRELSAHERPDLWLRSTAKNLVRNEIRKSSRRPHLISRYLTTLLLDHEEERQPSEVMDLKEQKSALRSCLEKLPQRTRDILDQRYSQDMTSQEIGAAFSMKSATVRRLLFRARATLAKCIQETGTTPPLQP